MLKETNHCFKEFHSISARSGWPSRTIMLLTIMSFICMALFGVWSVDASSHWNTLEWVDEDVIQGEDPGGGGKIDYTYIGGVGTEGLRYLTFDTGECPDYIVNFNGDFSSATFQEQEPSDNGCQDGASTQVSINNDNLSSDERTILEERRGDDTSDNNGSSSSKSILGGAGLLGLPRVELGESALETIFNVIFLLLGSASVIFMIIGGLRYTMSAGDPQKIEQAKKTIIYALVGLVVAMLAYAMVDFVSSQVIG